MDALTRHYTHDLSDQVLSQNPSNSAAILFCALPLFFVALAQLGLFSRNIRINHNFFVKTYPPTIFVIVITITSLISYVIISVYAVIDEAWTIKTWILFTTTLVLIGLAAIVYTADTQGTLVITLFIVVLAAIFNEWLFIDTTGMSQQDTRFVNWKHITRNLVGLNEAVLVLWAIHLIGQTFVHVFKGSSKSQVIIFWVLSAIVLIGIFLWNVLSFGPIFDSIGYLIASIFLLIGAFASVNFNKQDNEHIALNK